MISDFRVAAAGKEHLAGILAIYNYQVEHPTAIWTDAPVDIENRLQWWRGRNDAGFTILFAVAGDDVLGYASFGPFRPFEGHRQTVEHSVYVAEDARGPGVGSALLIALEAEARRVKMRVMLGGIAAENEHHSACTGSVASWRPAACPRSDRNSSHYLDLVFMQKLP